MNINEFVKTYISELYKKIKTHNLIIKQDNINYLSLKTDYKLNYMSNEIMRVLHENQLNKEDIEFCIKTVVYDAFISQNKTLLQWWINEAKKYNVKSPVIDGWKYAKKII